MGATETIRKRVYAFVQTFLNDSPTFGVHSARSQVDTSITLVERSVFDAVESVMAETHRMPFRDAVTFAAGWNPGMTFTTVAAPTTLTAPMIITAPHQIGGQP